MGRKPNKTKQVGTMALRITVVCALVAVSLTFASQLQAQGFSDRELILKTVDYKLDLTIDYENEKILGNCQLTVFNPSEQPIRQIPLTLYRLLKVTSVKDEQGADLSFTQQVLSFEDWEQLQVNYVEVSLKNPIQQGERKTISIQYEGYLLGYSETGMRYVKDRVDEEFTIIRPDCKAYPEVGYPSWRVTRAAGLQSFDYLVNVTVPESLVVANGGKLVGRVSNNGLVTYSYRNIKPAWRIDIAIAQYGILEDKVNRLRVFHFQEDKEGALMVLDALKETMKLYTKWFGLLRDYQGFAVIEIPEGFGPQTDVTCIIQTRSAFQSKEQLYQFYHEISHLWGVESRDPLPSRFESEGLAMFLQYLAQEKLEHKKGALEKGAQRLSESFRQKCQKNSRCKDVPVIDYGKEMLTDLSYSKGMILFYVLYKLVGENEFFKIMGTFYQKYNQTGATTDDFINHAREVSPVDLTKFFDEWVYGTESSEYIINEIPIEEIIKKYHQ